ncbi:MAG: hypothetical protein LBU24_00170 [Methanocalculaceae archaeon]|nr:hypothetical protein [Methanocalculaceae archaeon]
MPHSPTPPPCRIPAPSSFTIFEYASDPAYACRYTTLYNATQQIMKAIAAAATPRITAFTLYLSNTAPDRLDIL